MALITDDGFPPDVRVEKEALSLTQAGYKVTVLARRTSMEEAEHEALSSRYFVRRIRIPRASLLSGLLAKFTLIQSECFEPLERFIRSESIQVLHVHDFNLVPTTLRVAGRLGFLWWRIYTRICPPLSWPTVPRYPRGGGGSALY